MVQSAAQHDHDSHLATLAEAVHQANGMLSLPVYEKIASIAGEAPGPTFVEIGTAHGAATIALVLGARHSDLSARVYTVDPFGGRFSSRSRFGTVEENVRQVRENLARAGVADAVSLFVGTSDEFSSHPSLPGRIDLLMLDADGRIDRDMLHYYPLLSPDAVVIIDDVDDAVGFGATAEGDPKIDLKHRITSLLCSRLVSEDYLRVDYQIKNTLFFRRGERSMDRAAFAEMALDAYRELVFVSPGGRAWKELLEWREHGGDVRRALRLWRAVPRPVRRIALALRRLRPRKRGRA